MDDLNAAAKPSETEIIDINTFINKFKMCWQYLHNGLSEILGDLNLEDLSYMLYNIMLYKSPRCTHIPTM